MPKSKKIYIASDHAGVDLKESLQRLLAEYDWQDLGPSEGQRVDYPDYAEALANRVVDAGESGRGILICGSGIGMCISANKIPSIRAAVVENTTSARLSREHNNANVLCLGARFLAPEYAGEITRIFLETPFSSDPRHQKRVDKIALLDEKEQKNQKDR